MNPSSHASTDPTTLRTARSENRKELLTWLTEKYGPDGEARCQTALTAYDEYATTSNFSDTGAKDWADSMIVSGIATSRDTYDVRNPVGRPFNPSNAETCEISQYIENAAYRAFTRDETVPSYFTNDPTAQVSRTHRSILAFADRDRRKHPIRINNGPTASQASSSPTSQQRAADSTKTARLTRARTTSKLGQSQAGTSKLHFTQAAETLESKLMMKGDDKQSWWRSRKSSQFWGKTRKLALYNNQHTTTPPDAPPSSAAPSTVQQAATADPTQSSMSIGNWFMTTAGVVGVGMIACQYLTSGTER